MRNTLYEISWHEVGGVFSHCSVSPITVVREGVLPECTGVTITAIDANGHRFQGSSDNYYKTETEAWKAVKEELQQTLDSYEKDIKAVKRQADAIQKYLEELIES